VNTVTGRPDDGGDFPASEDVLREALLVVQSGQDEDEARVEDVRAVGIQQPAVEVRILEEALPGGPGAVIAAVAAPVDVADSPRERVGRLELRAVAEAADELRLQRVVDRVAAVSADDDGRIAQDAVGPQRRPRCGVAAGVDEVQAVGDAVAVVVPWRDLVGVVGAGQMAPLAAHVHHLERGVASDLALHARVPLPRVAELSFGIEAVAR
jgi:hypothetical protein